MMKLKWTSHGDLRIKRSPSLSRDEYLDWMTFKGGTQIPFIEIFGPLIGLKEEWEEQGATPEELDFSAFTFREPRFAGVPVNTGRMEGPSELLEETEEYAVYRDDIGRVMRLIKGKATIPLPETWPVRNMDDWLKIKPMYLFDESRFSDNWAAKGLQAREEGAIIQTSMPGGFDEPRQLMGEEALCYAYYEQPELIHDMLDTMGRTVCQVLDRVTQEVPVDVLFVHEDMAGKSGSLIGPREILTFIKPYYRRVWDLVSSRGARLFDQDSDGNMNSVIPAFLECGINCMHPMEPAAGMDIVAVRKEYGEKLAFKGGLDKFILSKTTADIDAELERKIPMMMETGGCMLGLDHRIPNGSLLENYRYYIRKVWEYIG